MNEFGKESSRFTMKAYNNESPADELGDLADLHIQHTHYLPSDIGIDRLAVDLSTDTSMPALFTSASENSVSLSYDIETWCSQANSTAAPGLADFIISSDIGFTHDELIHQQVDEDTVCDHHRRINNTDLLQPPGRVSPTKKHRTSQSHPASGSRTPVGHGKSPSLGTSPEIASMLITCLGKRDSDRALQRQASIDSGSEKKDQVKIPRHKRPSHVRAETKRRGKIQECFSHLTQLVPMAIENDSKTANAMSRKTKAAVLSQTADYCRRLCVENKSLEAEVQTLCAQSLALTIDINSYQSGLPAEGIDHKALEKTISADAMFRNYVSARSLANWKFWIFSQFLQSLFDSYNCTVLTSSSEDFLRTISVWVNDHLSLVALRPVVVNALLNICTSSSVVRDNQILPQEIQKTVLINTGLVTSNR